jgi:hypothetical protein
MWRTLVCIDSVGQIGSPNAMNSKAALIPWIPVIIIAAFVANTYFRGG